MAWQRVGNIRGPKGDNGDVDDELVDGSPNPVSGGAVKRAVDEIREAVEDIAGTWGEAY